MTLIARTRDRLRKMHPLTIATIVAVVFMLATGAAVAALISVSTSNSAAQRAADLATCVNNVLGERQKINDSPALIEQANANAAWAQAIVAAVAVPKDATPAEHAVATRLFIGAINDYARTTADVQRTLAAHQRERQAHPLGRC